MRTNARPQSLSKEKLKWADLRSQSGRKRNEVAGELCQEEENENKVAYARVAYDHKSAGNEKI